MTKILLVPRASNSVSTVVFSPVSAAMTAVTDATPITMPIVVSIDRTLFAQICPSARNALCRISSRIAIGRRRRIISPPPARIANGGRRLADGVLLDGQIGQHLAVLHADDPPGVAGDVRLVRHHDDRLPGVVQLVEQAEDFLARAAVEIAGRLVGQQDRGLVDQRPGDGDALLLAAGKLVGPVAHAIAQADGFQRLLRPRPPAPPTVGE